MSAQWLPVGGATAVPPSHGLRPTPVKASLCHSLLVLPQANDPTETQFRPLQNGRYQSPSADVKNSGTWSSVFAKDCRTVPGR